jgi:glycerol-3-phosphate dehydrogenase
MRDPNFVFKRDHFLKEVLRTDYWDIIVVGGGASGLGTALDAASRGFKTLLLEQSDFAKATSSRSTKLVHGGVRYLAQGNISLVYEALHERETLLKNAPHLVSQQSFIIPCYTWFDKIKYSLGLKLYDLLAGSTSFQRSKMLSKRETLNRLPEITHAGLIGGVEYCDGKFDDARLALNLAQTCAEYGGVLLNYMQVTGLGKTTEGKIDSVLARDLENGREFSFKSKLVINATGVFADRILKMDKPLVNPIVRPSQGVHIVLNRSFLAGDKALMIPKTSDGRILFALPWHGYVLVGTTDTPLNDSVLEPIVLEEELDFILSNVARYLVRAPGRKDILSMFAGLRPLAAPGDNIGATKEISRSHKIIVGESGMITVIGGKWTTYRKIAEDVIDKAIQTAGLDPSGCLTKNICIYGHRKMTAPDLGGADIMTSRSGLIDVVLRTVQFEMARTVEDVLARRLRILFLDARMAVELAPAVAEIMAGELGYDRQWEKQQVDHFVELASHYLPFHQRADF